MDHEYQQALPMRNMPVNSLDKPAAPLFWRRRPFWTGVLGVGLVWLMVGLVAMPAGVSFNPGKLYQASLIALLYLPACGLALGRRAALWRALWPQSAFRLLLALLAWAALSLLWGTDAHPGNGLSRLLSLLMFVLAWPLCLDGGERRGLRLLWLGGFGLALFALYYDVDYVWHPPVDGRMVADGVTATANYAAAVMGAACLWLCLLPTTRRGIGALRWLAVAVLLVFVALTDSRSIWLALAACALSAPFWWGGRAARWLAGGVLLSILASLLRPAAALVERGASLRPELFVQSMHLIAQHPWRGLGIGSNFILLVHGVDYTHSHNVLTQTLIELGLPGLLLLAALWAMVAWLGWRHRGRITGKLVLALWLYASVVLQFDMPQLLNSPRPGWLLVWLPLGLALWLEQDARRRATEAARLH